MDAYTKCSKNAQSSPDEKGLEAECCEREVVALNLSTTPPLQVQAEAAGKVLRVLKGHEGEVNSVSFSRDGTRIVSGRGRQYVAALGCQERRNRVRPVHVLFAKLHGEAAPRPKTGVSLSFRSR